jgi:pyridoxamine 5'-phosphate oxidase
MEIFNDLPAIWDFSWQQLEKAPHQKKNPWRTPVIANIIGGQASQRTVVLRRVDKKGRCLRFYADLRSAKISQKDEKISFSWLFYNAVKQIQLRVHTEGSVVSVEESDKIWDDLPVFARSPYASIQRPGSITAEPRDVLPPDFLTQTPAQTDAARVNFVAVDNWVTALEFLQLHRAGQRRARWSWEDNSWEGTWLIP